MNDRRREEEKERLMRELMNRKRNTVISKEGNEVVLTTGTEKPGQETEVNFGTVNASKDLLSRADDALLSLRKVLEGNQKELEQILDGLTKRDPEEDCPLSPASPAPVSPSSAPSSAVPPSPVSFPSSPEAFPIIPG